MLRPPHAAAGRRRSRGFSIVESMVGLAIGLVIVAGGLALFAGQLNAARRTMLEARLNQDLRSAADLIARDVRRAGYWQEALAGTVAIGAGGATAVNPYRQVSSGDSSLGYAFSRDAVEDNTRGAEELFGFRLTDAGMLEMRTAENTWNELVDPSLVRVTAFEITPNEVTIPLGHLCTTSCPPGTPNCPSTTVRRFDLLLRGQAVADAAVQRELRVAIRLRNDELDGQCPA